MLNANTTRRLIEVRFPIQEVSAQSRREKNIRHGHISTLRIWWARRPLAAPSFAHLLNVVVYLVRVLEARG